MAWVDSLRYCSIPIALPIIFPPHLQKGGNKKKKGGEKERD